MVFKIPVHLPRQAIKRLPRPAPLNWNPTILPSGFPYSTQQEIEWLIPSNAALSTWMAGPPSHPYQFLRVQDHQQVLPYTTLTFTLIADDVGPSPNTAFECNMGLDTGMTATQARDSVILQIRAWVAQFGAFDTNLRSLDAVPGATGNVLILRMPFGMTGAASITHAEPLGNDPSPRIAGSDNPLAFGILGKRRHIFGVRNALNGPYYGDVPPT